MAQPVLDTYQKAFELNMDKAAYGTIAEIGAGQETVRWFFRVGGAAGSIAKSLSAYDMQVSTAIYGSCQRFVSRERLRAMLDTEYNLLIQRLHPSRGSEAAFFAFANTVTTYSYSQKRAGRGWLGIRFQSAPNAEASQIDLHVVLKGISGAQDQETVGILGVNLIYGAYHYQDDPQVLLASLMDGLSGKQLEIDMIDFSGPAFEQVDNRVMALQLVQNGLTHAAMFTPDGKLVQPSDALYKKPVLIERSRFRPPTRLNMDMLDCAHREFCKEQDVDSENVIVLSEMTLQNLSTGDDIDANDFLQRVEILCSLGKNVMISNFDKYYRLAQYLFSQTNKPVAVALGVPSLRQIFNEARYDDLEGGIMEAFGRLFRNDMRMYVCPEVESDGTETTVDILLVDNHLKHLYQHLLQNGYIRNLDTVDKRNLSIHADEVLDMIKQGNDQWEGLVPESVATIIKQRGLFQK